MKKKTTEREIDPFEAILEQLEEYEQGTKPVSIVHEYSCFCGKEDEVHSFRSREIKKA